MPLLLRNAAEPVTDADKKFNIDEVIQRLSDSREPNEVTPSEDADGKGKKKDSEPKLESVAPSPLVKVETVKILVATEAIPAGTEITADLIADKFKEKELRKGDVDGAVDPKDKIGMAFTTGLGKGQWVTEDLVGDPPTKASPRDQFVGPKVESDTKPEPKPVAVKPPAKPKFQDTRIHTPTGTVVHRYEEVKPGQWKYVGVVPADGATNNESPSKPAPQVD